MVRSGLESPRVVGTVLGLTVGFLITLSIVDLIGSLLGSGRLGIGRFGIDYVIFGVGDFTPPDRDADPVAHAPNQGADTADQGC